MSDYRKLKVWRKANALSMNAHRAAARIRGSQYSQLRSQIIKTAMSVATNIVEGREQKTDASFARFVRHALSSSSELEYHLLSARDAAGLPWSDYQALTSQVAEVRMMLHGLLRTLDGPDNS